MVSSGHQQHEGECSITIMSTYIEKGSSPDFDKDRLEAEDFIIDAILEHSTNASTPKNTTHLTTPPHLPEGPSSCRSKEKQRKDSEARRKDRVYMYIYIYQPARPASVVVTPCWLVCPRVYEKKVIF